VDRENASWKRNAENRSCWPDGSTRSGESYTASPEHPCWPRPWACRLAPGSITRGRHHPRRSHPPLHRADGRRPTLAADRPGPALLRGRPTDAGQASRKSSSSGSRTISPATAGMRNQAWHFVQVPSRRSGNCGSGWCSARGSRQLGQRNDLWPWKSAVFRMRSSAR
jgi:hypothetical protein